MNVKTKIKLLIACATILSGLHAAAAQRESWEYLMSSDQPKTPADQKAWELLKECRHQGGEGAKRIIAEMPRIPHKYRNQAIEVLSRTQCQESREYLLTLALSSSDKYAAIVYLEYSGDSSAAQNLLQSTDSEIQLVALRGLMGSHGIDPVALDRAEWEVVKGLLISDSLELRRWATKVTARDSGTAVPVGEKAARIVASMLTTLTSLEAQNQSGYGSEGWSYSFPLGEGVLAEQAVSLGGMGRKEGKEEIRELLADLTPPAPRLVREGMMIARFLAGDHTLRGEVHRIATNCPSGRLRMVALEQALNFRTVTETDRECLERVAADDPLEGKPGSHYAYVTGDTSLENVREAKIYPARNLAKRTLKRLGLPKPKP